MLAQNKITKVLFSVLVFFVVLDLGLLVNYGVLASGKTQAAGALIGVGSERVNNFGSVSFEDQNNATLFPCTAIPERASMYDHSNDYGRGTLEEPYEIWTKEQFADLINAEPEPAYYLQCKDIDFADSPQFTIPYFNGHYNGNNFYLKGFKYQSEDKKFTGIFGDISNGGSVEHLKIGQSEVVLNSVNGAPAILAGQLLGANIDDIKIYNSKTTNSDGPAAGLAVRSVSSNISNIFIYTSFVSAKSSAAGLVDFSTSSTIKNIAISGGSVLSDDGYASGVVDTYYVDSFTLDNIFFENISYKGDVVSGATVAGIVGNLINGKLYKAEAETVLSVEPSSVGLETSLGGVAFRVDKGSVEKTHFKGTINRKSNVGDPCGSVGGVVGKMNESSMLWSYAEGQINLLNNCGQAGGGVGVATGSRVENSYADINLYVSGVNDVFGGLIGSVLDVQKNENAFENNRSNFRIFPSTGARVNYLGGHIGVAYTASFPGKMSFTSGALPNLASFEAGPYIGYYFNVLSDNSIPDSVYYNAGYSCSGKCNYIGTPESLQYLLTKTNFPLKNWNFGLDKWTQKIANTFPTIPSAKAN